MNGKVKRDQEEFYQLWLTTWDTGEMQTRFQEYFKEAERLVKETGYHRRDGELEKLKVKREK